MNQAKSKKKKNPFKRGKTWTFIVYLRDPETGNLKQKWYGGYKTEEEAKADMKIKEAEIVKGTLILNRNSTVAQYISEWFPLHSKTLAANTVRSYRNIIDLHVIPHIGGDKLSSIDRYRLNRLYDTLGKKGLSPKTVRYIHSTLRKVLRDAMGDGLLQKNPCDYYKPPKADKYTAVVLDLQQAQQLYDGVVGTPIETEIVLMLLLGLRRGEALGVRFKDVDCIAKTLHITQQVTTVAPNDEYVWGIKGLKTKESDRILALPAIVLDSINKRRKQVAADKLKAGNAYQNNDLICCNSDGTPKCPTNVYRQFKSLLPQLKLPDIRLHDLRHTYATLLFESGVELLTISRALGHASIAITADIYTDVGKKRGLPAELMGGLFKASNSQ